HPEGHPDCRDLELNIRHLQMKVDAGLDAVITQLFYDNADYFAFVERARRAGIGVPLIPGIMPITNVPQIERITALSGNQIPAAPCHTVSHPLDGAERCPTSSRRTCVRSCAPSTRSLGEKDSGARPRALSARSSFSREDTASIQSRSSTGRSSSRTTRR